MADDKKDKSDDDKAPIIVKKVKKGGGGHHGGAWKIAYADFVTAMMAFFLVMWLVNAADEKTKKALGKYFSPTISSRVRLITSDMPARGSSNFLAGASISSSPGASNSGSKPDDQVSTDDTGSEQSPQDTVESDLDKEDGGAFDAATEDIRDSLAGLTDLEQINDSVLIDVTHEGLRIQIVDAEGREMFKSGSAEPQPHALEVMKTIGGIIRELPNKISYRGHTDSVPLKSQDGQYTNWELSSDRAQTLRRVLEEAGVEEERVINVQGRAYKNPLDKGDTASPRNRRVSMILLRQSIVNADREKAENYRRKRQLKKREKGVIYFP